MFLRKQEKKSNHNKSEAPFFKAVQPKLKVGQPGDKYEKEADSVAEKVVNSNNDSASVQKMGTEEEVQSKPLVETISTGIQKMEEEPIQQMNEEEGLQKMEEEEPVQKMNEEEGLQKMEEEEPVQKMSEEEGLQKMEEEEPIQKKDEEEVQAKTIEHSSHDHHVQKSCNCPACKGKAVQKKSNNQDHSHKKTPARGFENSLNSSKGKGQQLDGGVQRSMENAIGADFSGVRVHTDSQAVQMNKDIGARAFTHGNDVYFNNNQYDPKSKSGKFLLAHELTHTVQQGAAVQKKQDVNQKTDTKVQGSFWGSLWNGIQNIGSGIADTVTSTLAPGWDRAYSFFGGGLKWVFGGLRGLGEGAVNWFINAGESVWNAIEWFGSGAWSIIQEVGFFLWEKISIIGINIWSFLSNIPYRFWNILVHLWDGVAGIFGWLWDGLSSAGIHVWNAVTGIFSWVGEGAMGLFNWVSRGLMGGMQWAIEFAQNPSWAGLQEALIGSISWLGDGFMGLVDWGWKGIWGALVWAWEGVSGIVSWVWDGVTGGLSWMGGLFMRLLDIIGVGEALQIIWGIVFRMRPLTSTEIAASSLVHPAGMVPYWMIRVDEDSWISYFGNAAVTTMHIIHAPKSGISTSTMVHELSHVAQYEHVGSVYMPQAVHAQLTLGRGGSGSAYDYERLGTLQTQRANGTTFSDLNRESQAQLIQDYYDIVSTNPASPALAPYEPFMNDMRRGEF